LAPSSLAPQSRRRRAPPARFRFDHCRSRPASCTGVRAYWHARTYRSAGTWAAAGAPDPLPGRITPGGGQSFSAHMGRPTTARTFSRKVGDIQRQWHVIDASDVVLGRLASQTAILLRGKHKPIFAPHVDTGDFVIVINAEKVALSGNKLEDKRAYRHSGYPGGLRSVAYRDLLARHPEKVVEKAVRGMLPKNSLGRQMLRKLKVY